MILASAGAVSGNARTITFALFALLVCVTLGITVWARMHTDGATDFYAGGRGFSGRQNGLALAGDHMSAASFLGISAISALSGYDGFLYSIGSLVTWVPVLGLRRRRAGGPRRDRRAGSVGQRGRPAARPRTRAASRGRAAGDVLLAFVAAVACATILAVVAGVMMAASTSPAHDLFGHVLMLGRPRERQEVAVARIAAVVIGSAAIVPAAFVKNLNVAFLVGLAFAVAASANLPAIVLSLFWRRLNGTGAVAGIYGGLATAVTLVVFSPVVSGKIDPLTGASLSLLPRSVDFAWFPLENPALVSIPAGFLCAVAGTLLSRQKADPVRFTELSTRATTGVGAS
jgi:Na+(H+)/acetate symporter ActP